jgi:hypothetical protein
MVEQRLDKLVVQQGIAGSSATLDRTPEGLRVSLLDGDGAVVSARSLPGDRACDDLAELAALVLASWLSDLTSQAASADPLPLLAAPPLPEPSPWSWELSLAPLASFAGSLAPGGLLAVGLGPAMARWDLRLAVAYDGPRSTAEGQGQSVSWQRGQLGLGGGYRFFGPPFSLEIGADLQVSDLFISGSGFSTDKSSTSLDPGVDLTARLVLLGGLWHPWVGVWATLWIRQEYPTVGPAGSTLPALPQGEGFVGLGLSWRSVERY